MTKSVLVLAVMALLSSQLIGDGPSDNLPDQVRRVPGLGIEVPAEKRAELEAGLADLLGRIQQLEASNEPQTRELLPDVRIFYRAVHDALEYQEFFTEKEIDEALKNLDVGKTRAQYLLRQRPGTLPPMWTEVPDNGLVVRGYRSKIDHTVQPYGLVVPKNYSHHSPHGFRLDVWFHGRGETLSENNFITQRRTSVGQFAPEDTIVLQPYGRYCNAFKFAGEVDVLEAIDDVRRRYNIDDDRISVRGFSMGGAACWQFAVHYADRWFAANPGAGFSETPQFLKSFQQETLQPTWWEAKLWGMYDCNLWATNLLQCPTVAYSGEIDIQKQAADVMEKALDQIGVKLTHVIGPNTAHKYHPDAAAEVARRLDSLALKGRERMPLRVDFTTYTLKYNHMHWVRVDGLAEHWQPATIRARITEPARIDVVAQNVTQFSLNIPSGYWPFTITEPVKLFVNGEAFDVVRPESDRSLQATFHADGEAWKAGELATTELRKRHGLQGPVDDALMDSFIFVRPTGESTHAAIDAWSKAELDRAIEHWRRHFRGDARVKNDDEITEDDLGTANLILWGDPESNQMLGKLAEKLPIRWGKNEIQVGDNRYAADHHALIAIYPNPLNPERYVVLNSSFTFREFAYLNNARQVAKLPDWAIVDVRTPPDALWPGKIVNANFFDEQWQLK